MKTRLLAPALAAAVLELGVGFGCARDFSEPFVGGADAADAGTERTPVVPDDGASPEGEDAQDRIPDVVTPAGPRCDRQKPFGAPVLAPGLASDEEDACARLSPDERTVWFSTDRGSIPRFRLYTSTRFRSTDPFPEPTLWRDETSSIIDPTFSPDGLRLLVQLSDGARTRISIATRSSPDGAFGAFTTFADLEQADQDEKDPYFGADGSIIFARQPVDGSAAADLQIASPRDAGPPTIAPVSELNGGTGDRDPVLSSDGLELYFSSNRKVVNQFRIYRATRKQPSGPFDPAQPVTEVWDTGTTPYEAPTWISPDGCHLYLVSDKRNTKTDIYVAARGK